MKALDALGSLVRSTLQQRPEDTPAVEQILEKTATEIRDQFPKEEKHEPYTRKRFTPIEQLSEPERYAKLIQQPELIRLDNLTPVFLFEIESKLTPLERKVLMAFAEQPHPLRIKELKRLIHGVEANTLSSILGTMIKKGFVRRNEAEVRTKHTYEIADPELLRFLVFRFDGRLARMQRDGQLDWLDPNAVTYYIHNKTATTAA